MTWTASRRTATYAAGMLLSTLIGIVRSQTKQRHSHEPPVWHSPNTNEPTNLPRPSIVGEPMPTLEDQLIACQAQLRAARAEGKTSAAAYLELRINHLLDQMPRKANQC
jgi:hypothetical protein